jgi:hypothetical protein
LTNTPTSFTCRRSAAAISAAWSTSQRRGLPAKKISPSAHAPRPAAACASSVFVMPQILTFGVIGQS